MRRLAEILLLLTGACLAQQDPLRVVIVTRASQLLPEAHERFRKTYGNGLIELRFGDGSRDLGIENASVIFCHYLGSESYRRLAPAVRQALLHGAKVIADPPENAIRHWEAPVEAALSEAAHRYWENGGAENLSSFLAFLYRVGGGPRTLDVPPPKPAPAEGIYHPRAKEPFTSLGAYLDWYRSNAPLVGILFFHTSYKNRDLAHIDALIAALEREGIGAVPVFGWPVSTLEPLLRTEAGCPLRLLFALNLSFSKPDDMAMFERLGLHVINLMTTRRALAEWQDSPQGMEPSRVSFQLAAPERAGATEPILIAATEDAGDGLTSRTEPIPERIEAAVRRARRWLVLQAKPNAEKRVAFIYFNSLPGKGSIGASYLDVFPTLVTLLERLRDEGYRVSYPIPDKRQLMELLERSGRNVEAWAPGELERMLEQGHLALVPMKKYRTWFAALPERFRRAVLAGWGPPEKSQLMTITSRDGEKFFVVPGVWLGNVFLGPQPLRSTFEREAELVHNITVPPPHVYIAAYLWYRYEFRADAVVHMGRHGTLEFLPGKNAGQAGWDASEVLLDDLPNVYYYIMDGGGESTLARRRGAAVIVSHLTPLVVAGGPQKEFDRLREALLNLGQTEETSLALAEQYRSVALEEIRRLKLDRQLGLDLERSDWDEARQRVEAFLEAAEAGPIPMGVHTVGRLPPEPIQKEALAEFVKSAFQLAEWRVVSKRFPEWIDALVEGRRPDVPGEYSPGLRDKVETALDEGRRWIEHLRVSPAHEVESLVQALLGRFLTSGPSGDPLRSPASLPSGRNLHDFDPALIPTRAAWEVGKKMAEETLARFRKQTARYPEKVSMVLWYGETVRHQGAMESEALYLMGVEPRWNSRGIVDDLRLIPEAELGRPRVDVVFTIAGIYRDGFADKVLLLDRAARLAASAGDNAIRRHTEQVAAALKRAGVRPELAEKAARVRFFGAAPGDYGAGISKLVKQSKDAGNARGLVEAYLNHMNHAYSAELWGEAAPAALAQHLAGNEAVIHSRSTNVYGVLDNDDFFDFAGGLSLATQSITGAAPQFYVNNLRGCGRERIEGMREFLAAELNARFWNPKWIRQMQEGGYAGAREVADNLENLYGWQATSPGQTDGSFWQNSYDVYVADKHGLEMDAFFEKSNPHARQGMFARLLEVDRQGSYRFSEEDRARLVKEYVLSVNHHGIGCSANTCGNLRLNQYVATLAPLVPDLGNRELLQFGQALAQATRWTPREFVGAPTALRAGVALAGKLRPGRAVQMSQALSRKPPVVSGFRLHERTISLGPEGMPRGEYQLLWVPAVLALIGLGVVREATRSRCARDPKGML
jgi:cobaltochelatase CobN